MRFWQLALLFCFFSTSTLANETRLGTLRDPMGVKDETQTFIYPAMVNEYSLALVELGTRAFNQVYGGAMKDLGGSSAGIVVSRDDVLMTGITNTQLSLVDEFLSKTASNTAANAGQAILPVPERPVEFLYGMGSKSNGWGLRLVTATYRAINKDTAADTKTEAKAEQMDLFFGYSTFGAGRMDIGVGLGVLGTLKTKADATDTTYEYKRGNQISLYGRKFLRSGKGRLFFGGAAIVRSPEIEVNLGGVEEDKKFDERLITLEGGYLAIPTKDVRVNLAAQAGLSESKGPVINAGTGIGSGGGTATPSILTTEDTVKRSANWITTSIGVEAPVSGAFGILGGMSYAIFGSLEEDNEIAETETEVSIPQTADNVLWSLGLFYSEGPLRADASYSKTFLHDGPNFISGNTTTPLLAQISVTYGI